MAIIFCFIMVNININIIINIMETKAIMKLYMWQRYQYCSTKIPRYQDTKDITKDNTAINNDHGNTDYGEFNT